MLMPIILMDEMPDYIRDKVLQQFPKTINGLLGQSGTAMMWWPASTGIAEAVMVNVGEVQVLVGHSLAAPPRRPC